MSMQSMSNKAQSHILCKQKRNHSGFGAVNHQAQKRDYNQEREKITGKKKIGQWETDLDIWATAQWWTHLKSCGGIPDAALLLLGEFQSVAEDLESRLFITESTCLGRLTVDTEHLPKKPKERHTDVHSGHMCQRKRRNSCGITLLEIMPLQTFTHTLKTVTVTFVTGTHLVKANSCVLTMSIITYRSTQASMAHSMCLWMDQKLLKGSVHQH